MVAEIDSDVLLNDTVITITTNNQIGRDAKYTISEVN